MVIWDTTILEILPMANRNFCINAKHHFRKNVLKSRILRSHYLFIIALPSRNISFTPWSEGILTFTRSNIQKLLKFLMFWSWRIRRWFWRFTGRRLSLKAFMYHLWAFHSLLFHWHLRGIAIFAQSSSTFHLSRSNKLHRSGCGLGTFGCIESQSLSPCQLRLRLCCLDFCEEKRSWKRPGGLGFRLDPRKWKGLLIRGIPRIPGPPIKHWLT